MSEPSELWRGRAEQAEQLCRDLFDNAPIGYVRTDLEGNVLLVNGRARSMLGLGRGATGRPLTALASPADRPAIRRLTAQVATEPDGVDAEVELAGAGKPPAPFLVRVRPEHHGDALASLRWTLHDLSQQHHTADLLADLRRRLALVVGERDEVTRLTTALDQLGEILLERHRTHETMLEVLEILQALAPAAESICLLTAEHELTALGLPFGGAAGERELALGDGLALETLREGRRRASHDLRIDPRWPGLAASARSAGVAAALGVPLPARGRTLGVVVVYSGHAGAFDETIVRSLEGVAHRVGVVLANLQSYAYAVALADQLEEAMSSRGVIEQAKGILMQRLGLNADQAFAHLRSDSQHQHRKLHEVAADLVQAAVTPRSFPLQHLPSGD